MQPVHEVQDRQELLRALQAAPNGTHVGDLKDAYPLVLDDVKVHTFTPWQLHAKESDCIGMQFPLYSSFHCRAAGF